MCVFAGLEYILCVKRSMHVHVLFVYCVPQRPTPCPLAHILSAYFREVKELFRLNQSWEKEMKLVSFWFK